MGFAKRPAVGLLLQQLKYNPDDMTVGVVARGMYADKNFVASTAAARAGNYTLGDDSYFTKFVETFRDFFANLGLGKSGEAKKNRKHLEFNLFVNEASQKAPENKITITVKDKGTFSALRLRTFLMIEKQGKDGQTYTHILDRHYNEIKMTKPITIDMILERVSQISHSSVTLPIYSEEPNSSTDFEVPLENIYLKGLLPTFGDPIGTGLPDVEDTAAGYYPSPMGNSAPK